MAGGGRLAGQVRAGLRTDEEGTVAGLPSLRELPEPGRAAAEGRRFGVTVGLAFLVLAGLLWWRGHVLIASGAGGLGGALLLAALLAPARLGPVQNAWMAMAKAISKVTTPLVMGLVYFLVLTPTGWVRRTLSRNPLRHPRRNGSFWIDRRERSDLKRQF